MISLRTAHRRWKPATAVLGLALLATACSGDSKPPATPTPTTGAAASVTVTPGSATPTATPERTIEIETARRLESEGDYEAAASAYLALVNVDGPSREEAVLGAGRLLLEIDEPEQARQLIEAWVEQTEEPAASRARFLLARTFAALEDTDAALEQYDLYIAAGLPALPYAHFERAVLLAEDGQAAEAAAEAEAGLAYDLPGAVEAGAILAIARAFEAGSNYGDALAWYEALLVESGSGADQALALRKTGEIKETLGDATYLDDYNRLLAEFPASPHAHETLDYLTDAGFAVDAYTRGLVYYRQNRYGDAAPAFDEAIAAAPDAAASAEAYYYRAAIYEAEGSLTAAVDYYSRVLVLNPNSFIADDSLWWRARIAEDDGDAVGAGALMTQLANEYPNSSFAAEAAFRAGLLPYRAGLYADAASVWGQGLLVIGDPAERERLTLWQGKANVMSGNAGVAAPDLEGLAFEREDDYYGVRAGSLLRGDHGQPQAVTDSGADLTPAFDWPAAEAWLTSHTGRALNDTSSTRIYSDPRWQRSEELLRLGRRDAADSEGFAAIEAYASDPIAMYQVARLLADQGRMSLSARAGQRLLRVLDLNPNQGLPPALLSLSYPAAYARLVERHAAEAGVSPLLMLALMRQESFFDPRAESPAGAFGLSQVLPGTAASMARGLGLPEPEIADLKEADLNLQLGATYLRNQLADFGQDLYVALAAYNAGPNAASRWVADSGGDADLYLELVEFSETRHYIQFVSENYAIYRFLYGGSEVPNLPSD